METTIIPNSLLDRWLITLNGDEFKVMVYIIRHSDIQSLTDDRLSLTAISAGTGMDRRTVRKAMKVLESLASQDVVFTELRKSISLDWMESSQSGIDLSTPSP